MSLRGAGFQRGAFFPGYGQTMREPRTANRGEAPKYIGFTGRSPEMLGFRGRSPKILCEFASN